MPGAGRWRQGQPGLAGGHWPQRASRDRRPRQPRDDLLDGDGDAAPDACDPCPTDNPDDSDETGDTGEADTGDTGPEPLGVAAAKLIGEDSADFAGTGVADAGDVNGDGQDDLLIGAFGVDVGDSSYAGAAYLFMGPVSGRRRLSTAEAKLVGIEDFDETGIFMAGAGDADRDGYADILLGELVRDVGEDATAARLFYGPVSGVIRLDVADVGFTDGSIPKGAYDVAALGDSDADGWEDLLIGAPGGLGWDLESDRGHCADDDVEEYSSEHGAAAGRVYVVSGPHASEVSLSTAGGSLIGEDGGDQTAVLADDVGDLDGDGVADIFVGSPRNCEAGLDAGAAYVVAGPVTEERSLSDADAKLMPDTDDYSDSISVAAGGDSDGDGYGDMVVAWTWGGDAITGIVYVVLGPALGPVIMEEADASFLGEASGDSAGSSVAWIGDANLDGFDDLAIGANKVDVPAREAGAVYQR